MRTSRLLARAAHGTRSRRVGAAVALMACFGLAACTATEPPSPASTAAADTIAPLPQAGHLDAGTYRVTGYPVPFEVTVPDGWLTFDGSHVAKDDPDLPDTGDIAVTFWPAARVATDACAWRAALVQVDSTAEAFIEAMMAQASTVSSPPVKVLVGDYSGFEFDHTVERDLDITACDGGRLCINSDSAQECDGRQYRNAGERATYRVIDLDGERAVIVLSQPHESIDPRLTREARAILESIEFVRPAE